MPVNPLPKPPFVVLDAAAYSGGGLKPAKFVCLFDMGAGYFSVGYSIAHSGVIMRAIRRKDILYGQYTVTTDSPRQFAQTMRDLAIRKGVSFEAYLTLGQMKPFNREEEVAMAKLSRKADPEPEEDEVEEAPAVKAKGKAKAAPPPPAKTKRRAAAPEPEPEEDEVEDEEEEEPEEEEEEEEPEEAPAAKAKAKAKAGAAKAVGKSAAANKKPAPAPAPTVKRKSAAPANGGRNVIDSKLKIKILHKGNPYREGTKAAATFDLMTECKTVGEFRENVDLDEHDPGYLRYASRDGYVTFV